MHPVPTLGTDVQALVGPGLTDAGAGSRCLTRRAHRTIVRRALPPHKQLVRQNKDVRNLPQNIRIRPSPGKKRRPPVTATRGPWSTQHRMKGRWSLPFGAAYEADFKAMVNYCVLTSLPVVSTAAPSTRTK